MRLSKTDVSWSNPWPDCQGLPEGPRAVLAALHLRVPCTDALARLGDRQWRQTLEFCDRSRLTLALREAAREDMPAWVRERTDENAASTRRKLALIETSYRELAARLTAAGVDFLALKGITHCALFGRRPEERVQYDIDLFAPDADIYAARDALVGCGYEAVEAMEGFPTDHLPLMIRKTTWEWRGDYFDPGIPLSVDLHFQFWNEKVERLAVPRVEEFWDRRTTRRVAGFDLSVLSPADAMGYSALHLLRHLLRGSVCPFHVLEMAGLLESLAGADDFWEEWRAWHTPELRRLEAVAFRLAVEWFGCRMAAAVEEEIRRLSDRTEAWFHQFATSPAKTGNKDEIFLHGTLVASRQDAWRIARRRLMPMNLPPRAGNWLRYAAYSGKRVWHHAAALAQVAGSGARWWMNSRVLNSRS